MKKPLLLTALVLVGVLITSCAPPPALRSDKYLNDTSLVASPDACSQAPCFHDIVVGQTTFVDAVSKIKANTNYSNLQQQDRTDTNPAQAAWSTAGGEQCCNMIENKDTGLVEAILLRVAPNMTIAQVVKKYGDPKYVITGDYSSSESVVQLIYPKQGSVIWVVPGDATSTLQEANPVVAELFLDTKQLNDLLIHTPLLGWAGYKSYAAYASATPIQTAIPTQTPTPTK